MKWGGGVGGGADHRDFVTLPDACGFFVVEGGGHIVEVMTPGWVRGYKGA